MFDIGLAAPMPLLLQIHDLLNPLEVGVGDQRGRNHLNSNDIFSRSRDLTPISLSAIKLSQTPVQLRLRPPTIGEHTHSIMTELGFSADEIADYREARII